MTAWLIIAAVVVIVLALCPDRGDQIDKTLQRREDADNEKGKQ